MQERHLRKDEEWEGLSFQKMLPTSQFMVYSLSDFYIVTEKAQLSFTSAQEFLNILEKKVNCLSSYNATYALFYSLQHFRAGRILKITIQTSALQMRTQKVNIPKTDKAKTLDGAENSLVFSQTINKNHK